MKTVEYLRWWWRTRNCDHKGERIPVIGEERFNGRVAFQCAMCGRVVR